MSNIDSAEDLGGSLAIDINSHVSAISYFTELMSACDERLNAETKGIAELDTYVAEATMIRQDVHAESVTVTASNASTSKLLRLAINRLTKFYARALHKATPKAKLSVQDWIYVNMGGEISTAAPTGIAGTDVAHLQVLQEPAAEPFTSKFEKKTEGLSGLLALLKELMADVEELTKARIVEKNSQEQNEDFRTESSKSRADSQGNYGANPRRLQQQLQRFSLRSTSIATGCGRTEQRQGQCGWCRLQRLEM